MKKFGLFLFALLLAVSPAMAVIQTTIGETYQCWTFDGDEPPPSQFGILADDDQNPFGTPAAMINDMSGRGVYWTNNIGNGAWVGEEFKIFLDIPNQNLENPYKLLTVTMQFQGTLSFSWVADVVSGDHFDEVTDQVIRDGEAWRTYTQTFRFEPNPRQEIVVIGIKGFTDDKGAVIDDAILDRICISTQCIPEPMTLALLAAGGFFVLRSKRS